MDDEEIFRRSMASIGVEPLDDDGPRAVEPEQRSRPTGRRRGAPASPGPQPADDSRKRQGQPTSVRRRKTRNRDVWYEDQVDLHRLRSVEALRRLESFIQRSAALGYRRVLVITGKGHHSPGGRGVLRERVEEWIRGPGGSFVTEYAEAPRARGGSGAFVLDLRRAR